MTYMYMKKNPWSHIFLTVTFLQYNSGDSALLISLPSLLQILLKVRLLKVPSSDIEVDICVTVAFPDVVSWS